MDTDIYGFQQLPLAKMELVNKNDHQFRVYDASGKFITVEAHSVREALELANVSKPTQIIPVNMLISDLLQKAEIRPINQNF
ncbi:MAG: hypothetical protein IPP74_04830 [Alphaproteobacteria bacterium]|nr:hypothetical protein [Alphaproteobacteria bacterium]